MLVIHAISYVLMALRLFKALGASFLLLIQSQTSGSATAVVCIHWLLSAVVDAAKVSLCSNKYRYVMTRCMYLPGAFFCSKKCQKKAWKVHKATCHPFNPSLMTAVRVLRHHDGAVIANPDDMVP